MVRALLLLSWGIIKTMWTGRNRIPSETSDAEDFDTLLKVLQEDFKRSINFGGAGLFIRVDNTEAGRPYIAMILRKEDRFADGVAEALAAFARKQGLPFSDVTRNWGRFLAVFTS